MTEKLWYLKCCDLFRRLGPDELAQLELHSRSRQFPRGAPIYLPADEADGVLLVAAGRVKICSYTLEGKQAILAFVTAGEVFGELSLLEGGSREEYAEAVEKSHIILIPADILGGIVEHHADLSLGITKLFGLRRRRIERRLKYLLFRSNRERLVSLLLEMAEQYGEQTDMGVNLRIKLSHQDLASVIGSTRETVTVLLGELQSEGHVSLGRRKVMLVNPSRLAATISVPPPVLTAKPLG